jgi:hypothetical protein
MVQIVRRSAEEAELQGINAHRHVVLPAKICCERLRPARRLG